MTKGGRDWASEPWVKLFTRDSQRWGRLSLAARGLYCLLQRGADRTARIEVDGEGATDAADAVAHLLRAPAAAIELPLAELQAAGYVALKGRWLLLPEHLEQQESRSTGTQRSKDSREAKHAKNTKEREEMQRGATQGNEVQRDATKEEIDQIDQIDLLDQKQESRRAGAREAAPPLAVIERDPRAAEIATALAASSRFAGLKGDVAEALLGHLGPLALQLDAGKIGEAIAAAALELADGATERETRRLLGWKFKDALEPQKARIGNGKSKHLVQGDPNMKQFIKNVAAGRPAWDNGDGAS